jgi:hypothetical protein
MTISLAKACLAVSLAARCAVGAPGQTLLSVDAAPLTTFRPRTVGVSSLGGAGAGITAAADVRRLIAPRSPDSSAISAVMLDASGTLAVRTITDSGTSAAITAATGVPVTTPAPVAAAYFSPSGTLVLAYASAGSTACTLRTFTGGAFTAAVTAPFTLSSTPARVELATRPGSNEVLLVAQDSTQNLAATIWNGTAFRATETLDNAYTGGTKRWDLAWTPSGTPVVAWVRAAETALRARHLVSSRWTTPTGTPTLAAAINRVTLATNPTFRTGGAAAAIASDSGEIVVADIGASSWSSAISIATNADTTLDNPLDLAFEGRGGGLVCAWLPGTADRASLRRRDSSGIWAAATTTAAMDRGCRRSGWSRKTPPTAWS